ncbi:MAG: response regulator transcription factor [Ignavibacterium sp.]
MKKKILLVDDEKDIIEFLKYNLEQEDFTVITAYDGDEALKKIKEHPDLIILDILMPKMNGYDVCRNIRTQKEFDHIPVIFLTAKSSEIDEILGLELGASDFIQKPISPKKLIARVNSNLRKNFPEQIDPDILSFGPVRINKKKYTVFIDDVEIPLPRKEFDILYILASSPGIIFNREALLSRVWGSEIYVVDRTIDVHIRKIREKLEPYSDLIETVKGVGYRFKDVE